MTGAENAGRAKAKARAKLVNVLVYMVFPSMSVSPDVTPRKVSLTNVCRYRFCLSFKSREGLSEELK